MKAHLWNEFSLVHFEGWLVGLFSLTLNVLSPKKWIVSNPSFSTCLKQYVLSLVLYIYIYKKKSIKYERSVKSEKQNQSIGAFTIQ